MQESGLRAAGNLAGTAFSPTSNQCTGLLQSNWCCPTLACLATENPAVQMLSQSLLHGQQHGAGIMAGRCEHSTCLDHAMSHFSSTTRQPPAVQLSSGRSQATAAGRAGQQSQSRNQNLTAALAKMLQRDRRAMLGTPILVEIWAFLWRRCKRKGQRYWSSKRAGRLVAVSQQRQAAAIKAAAKPCPWHSPRVRFASTLCS